MKRIERLTAIRNIVDEEQRVELTELSDRFGVSVVTIRKDVEILQERNQVRRVHGAVIALSELSEYKDDHYSRLTRPDIHKERIGRIAAEQVSGTGWIFLGQGSTCYHVGRELAKMDGANVLTNNLLVAEAMARNKRTNVIVIGGNLIHNYFYTAGEMFMRNMDDLHIAYAFMGVGGIDQHAGYTVNYSTELVVFDTISKITDKLILVADSDKFGKKRFLSLGDLDYADTLITDTVPPEPYRSWYQDHGVKVLY